MLETGGDQGSTCAKLKLRSLSSQVKYEKDHTSTVNINNSLPRLSPHSSLQHMWLSMYPHM